MSNLPLLNPHGGKSQRGSLVEVSSGSGITSSFASPTTSSARKDCESQERLSQRQDPAQNTKTRDQPSFFNDVDTESKNKKIEKDAEEEDSAPIATTQVRPKWLRRKFWCAVRAGLDDVVEPIGNPYGQTGSNIDARSAMKFDINGKPSLSLSFRISKDPGKDVMKVDDEDRHDLELLWEPGVKFEGKSMVADFQGKGHLDGSDFPDSLRKLAKAPREHEMTYRIRLESNSPRRSSYDHAWTEGLKANERAILKALFEPKMTPFPVTIWFVQRSPTLRSFEDDCVASWRDAVHKDHLP